MSLEAKITEDLKTAMKAKDQVSLRTIRAIKSAIILLKTDGSGKEIDEKVEIKLIQKLAKQRQDSLDIYEKQNREDLAKVEREELAVLKRYLPEQIGEAELTEVISGIISELGAEGMKDMGRVMGAANGKLAGKADGKSISTVVKKLLTS